MRNNITLFLKTTALLKSVQADEDDRFGTCFFISFNNHILLVTNKHIVNYSNKIVIYIEILNKQTNIQSEMQLHLLAENTIYNEKYDLCVLDITTQIKEDTKYKLIFDQISQCEIADDLTVFNKIQDVFMIGYPNTIRDIKNSYPIIRKGITSTLINIDWDGNKEFLIDIIGIPGSSGSPIFAEYNTNYYLVGINYESFDYNKKTSNGILCLQTGISKIINSSVLLDMVCKHFS